MSDADWLKFEVRRKGRQSAPWRVLFRGSPTEAQARFDREREKMRQGVLDLISPEGSVLAHAFAPLLRTRW